MDYLGNRWSNRETLAPRGIFMQQVREPQGNIFINTKIWKLGSGDYWINNVGMRLQVIKGCGRQGRGY